MKYFFYIIRSQVTEEFYLGQTSNLEDRMIRHNNKRSNYTKRGTPWILVYYETFLSRKDAINRERFLKSPQGWKTLQEIKQNLPPNVAQPVPKGSLRD